MIYATWVHLADDVVVGDYAVVGRVAPRDYTARDPGPPTLTIIGQGTLIGCHAVIYAGCTIGERCMIGDGSSLYVNCWLGDRVRLGRNVNISYAATIGSDTVIMDGSCITGCAVIGERCFIGPGVQMANDPEPRQGYDAQRLAPPVIGNDVLIGVGAIICPGITIGDGATIGAGAIVSEDVPAGATVAAARGRRVQGRPIYMSCGGSAPEYIGEEVESVGRRRENEVTKQRPDRAEFGDFTPTYIGAQTYPQPLLYISVRRCSRCTAPLDNVASGYAVIAGGQLVCTECLQPGEEILRARSVEAGDGA